MTVRHIPPASVFVVLFQCGRVHITSEIASAQRIMRACDCEVGGHEGEVAAYAPRPLTKDEVRGGLRSIRGGKP